MIHKAAAAAARKCERERERFRYTRGYIYFKWNWAWYQWNTERVRRWKRVENQASAGREKRGELDTIQRRQARDVCNERDARREKFMHANQQLGNGENLAAGVGNYCHWESRCGLEYDEGKSSDGGKWYWLNPSEKMGSTFVCDLALNLVFNHRGFSTKIIFTSSLIDRCSWQYFYICVFAPTGSQMSSWRRSKCLYNWQSVQLARTLINPIKWPNRGSIGMK